MTPQPDKATVITPFVPDAREDVHDFRPVYQGAGPDPKVESALAPVEPAPSKGPAKKPVRKAPEKKVKTTEPKTTTTDASEPIATVVEELPPS